jgi:hypothetical protein
MSLIVLVNVAWYKNGTVDGRVVAVFPATNVAFMEAMRDPRWEDYQYGQHTHLPSSLPAGHDAST